MTRPLPTPLAALRPLSWPDERDLRAHFNDELAGRMGLRSNLGPLIDQLRLGCRVQADHPTFDIDAQVLQEAGRSREAMRRLRALPWAHVRVLKALYGPRTAPALGAFTDALLGDLTPVVLIAPATKRAHEASRSTRELGDWLVRLAHRAQGGQGPSQARDMAKVAALLLEARLLSTEAIRAFEATREPRQKRMVARDGSEASLHDPGTRSARERWHAFDGERAAPRGGRPHPSRANPLRRHG